MDFVSVCAGKQNANGIGVLHLGDGINAEFVLQAPLLRDLEGMADPQIVRWKAHHPCQQRTIGAVPPIGMGKGSIEGEFHPFGAAVDQPSRKVGDPQRPRRVGAGGSYHIGPDDIKDSGGHKGELLSAASAVLL